MSNTNELDILDFISRNSDLEDESTLESISQPNDDLDFQTNDDSIVPSFTLDSFDFNPQSSNVYVVSNTNEFIETLNQTSIVNNMSIFGESHMGPSKIQQYSFLNPQPPIHVETELKPFRTPVYENVKQIILDVEQFLGDRQSELENYTHLHRKLVNQFLANHDVETLDAIKSLFQSYIETIETTNSALCELNKLKVTTILEPHEIDRSLLLGDNLEMLNIYFKLYASELHMYIQEQMPSVQDLVAFFISNSPFPGVWIKKSQMTENESVNVQVISSPSIDLRATSEVKANIIINTPTSSKAKTPKSIIDNDTLALEEYSKNSKFKFMFLSGTRKDVAQFVFSVNLETNVSDRVLSLRSPPSRPFIVITNECQYADSSGILFLKDVFEYQWGKPMNELPWPFFANSIQHYFLKATRQDLKYPIRGLSRRDLNYISQFYFSSSLSICRKPFQSFWNWFGKVLHKLRYQRHTALLWSKGLFYGMLSREGVWRFLNDQPIGTFILRFSESNAGSIAIGYKAYDGSIKNYLMKHEDTTGNSKTIPDFIRQRPELLYLLQYYGDDDYGNPQLAPIPKDIAFLNMYSVKPKVSVEVKGNPYDEF